MKILIVGGGAREHALAWRLHEEGAEIVAAPGNGGMAAFARCVPAAASDVPALLELALQEKVELVVIGPEAPLVAGLVDRLEEAGIAAFGPRAAAARLEGSKIYSKELMARHGIPTASFRIFDDPGSAEAYVRAAARPLVVKADGLAAGKGVFVASEAEEAIEGIDRIMRERAFGEAGDRILIEECLVGEEVSYHVVSDGERYVALAPAQDHKRALEGDRGPNTGGMGAYSPPPIVDEAIERVILERIVEPTLAALEAEGTPFRGALFVGLMIVEGEPFVLEYNVRFGDPECEVLMSRWKGPILPLLEGSARGDLSGVTPAWEAPASLCVVLAAGGYPGPYEKGLPIEGIAAADRAPGVRVFHAGTRREGKRVLSNGGRVLAVTA
ncbi:MAG: phosphoribosylamine--glycine ligase, partial [Myxococcales bacterium]|nr:phosphoribosylamine--glycine ligase [Myxococcales bacterium]